MGVLQVILYGEMQVTHNHWPAEIILTQEM
jgi:hypothetical protein